MKKVKLIGPGLKLNNKWSWCGDTVVISDTEFEKNAEYLELIEDVEDKTHSNNKNNENNNNIITENNENTTNNNNDGGENNNPETPEENNPNGDEDGQDDELELLRAEAKSLGINPGNAKKDTLLKKIEEVKAKSSKE